MEVGVLGDGALADRIHEVADAEGAAVTRRSTSDGPDDDPVGDALASDPEATAALDAIVTVGESALLALVREVGHELDRPVLPIDAGPGYGAVPEADADAAVEALLAGEFDAEARTVLDVSVGGEPVGQALADAMLVTTEPARISEYAVRSGDELVEQFRADGVVVSTPTGSHGYGRSAGGPLLQPGSDALGVVPVAPFAVNADHWVLSADRPVTLRVERDEGEVSLLLDDRIVREVPLHTPVEVAAGGTLSLAQVAESRPFFER